MLPPVAARTAAADGDLERVRARSGSGQGRHVKQSGGHGRYAVVLRSLAHGTGMFRRHRERDAPAPTPDHEQR